jgi:ubiquinone/menaquinone biosynthesis C-methylase UbiE
MSQNKKEIDWSEKCWKEMLVYQRRFLWLEDTVDKLAVWMGLKPPMTAVDVGCGLGYLGYTYWPYFGAGGRYLGLDISSKLLQDAIEAAKEWAVNGEAHFVAGDAYRLPFPDDFADLVMCHILLIHLEKPQLALAEMIRVAKPGGLIVCKEPDNLSTILTLHYPSIPELDIEEQLLFAKIALICNKGRIRRGQGDNSLGRKIPGMMKQMGLTDIGVRMNDRAYWVEPPYEGPLQQYHLEWVKKRWLDEKKYEVFMDREKKEFLAGGGDPEEYDRYRKIHNRIRPIIRQQIEDGEYFECGSGDLYVIKARKPE